MKQYAKLVEAIQYQGDLEQVKELLGDVVIEVETNPLIINDPETGRWGVQPGDYIVKDFKGILVYKPARFEAEFDEVNVEDVVSEQSKTIEDLHKLENEVGAYPASSADSFQEAGAQNTEGAAIAPKSKKFPPKE